MIKDHDDPAPDDGTPEKGRIRLHPRVGSEHRYRFARRWESRKRSRPGTGVWRILMLDIGAIALLYLLGRQILRKFTG
jgi:hypothetical protein